MGVDLLVGGGGWDYFDFCRALFSSQKIKNFESCKIDVFYIPKFLSNGFFEFSGSQK